MKDESYIDSEYPRILQAKKIITQLQKWKTGSNIRLLDVGAGAGILVKKASNEGFLSEGIEPLKYLTDIAIKKNIKVNYGTLDDYKFDYKFDIVTCVDVIEHVSDPIRLLKGIFANLKENGIALIITPDVNSLMSKIMKWKWWHIRVAHIAYFNKKTLKIALDKTQFKAIYWSRPTWFFSIGYLIDRISVYFPFFEVFKKFKLVNKVIIPLNLRDSYSVIVRKKDR
jgi:2-polyprenyl-3-methyl-5-hydroxy-6-metoxy-1,4-benzoquinol methylase